MKTRNILFLCISLLLWAGSPSLAQERPDHVLKQGPFHQTLMAEGDQMEVDASGPADVAVAGGELMVRGTVGGDLMAAGGEIRIDGPVKANALVAGGRITQNQPVAGDMMAAGGQVEIRGAVGDDLRLAGGELTVSSTVGGDLMAAGGSLRVDGSAKVEGLAALAGGMIVFDGQAEQGLRASGGEVQINGTVKGDVQVTADKLILGPKARLLGNLAYTSPHPANIDPAAQIAGKTAYTPAPLAKGWPWALLFGVFFVLSLAVVGWALYLLLPQFTRASVETLIQRPGFSFLLGLALFSTGPVLAVLLMVTLVGLPLGLLLLVVYKLLGITGWLTTALALAWLAANRAGRGAAPSARRVLALQTLVVFLMVAVALVPWLGCLAMLTAVFMGMGAVGHTLYSQLSPQWRR